MVIGAVDWFLRDEYWIMEGGRKTNNIWKLTLAKVEKNSLIRATGDYYVLAIPHQPPNELVSPDSFRF
jgi:hypothetical protein